MKWKILTLVYTRIEAEMIKAALEALQIPAELVQEGVAHWAIPLTFGDFAEIQILVPPEHFEEAKKWLEAYENEKEIDIRSNMDASKTVILVTNYGMGKSDEALQLKLLGKYLQLITEGGLLPNSICFYADGVKSVTADSPLLPQLKAIEEKGVRLIVCSTCLEHLGLEAAVGIVGGMPDIIEAQFNAEKVITL